MGQTEKWETPRLETLEIEKKTGTAFKFAWYPSEITTSAGPS